MAILLFRADVDKIFRYNVVSTIAKIYVAEILSQILLFHCLN